MAHDEVQTIMNELRTLRHEFAAHRTCAQGHWEDNIREREENKAFREEMRPVLEAQHWIIYTQKFLKWAGISVVATIAFFYWLYKKV
jgi:hypothetical protein